MVIIYALGLIFCLGDSPLNMQFPMVSLIIINQEAKISDYLHRREFRVVWNVTLTRSLNDWEIVMYQSLLVDIYESGLNCWKWMREVGNGAMMLISQ